MNGVDVVIILIAVVAVVGTIVLGMFNKKKGKTSCGCDCSKCSGCSSCNIKDKNKDTANK